MKKFLFLTVVFIFSMLSTFAYKSVMQDDNGKIQIKNLAEKNDLVPTTNLSIFVDLYRDGLDDVSDLRYHYSTVKAIYWSDCEVKVLDKNGKIVYFFSTIAFDNRQVQELHKAQINDFYATVYYYVSGSGDNACVKPKKLFPSSKWNSSIGATEKAYAGNTTANDNKVRITAIQIYPSKRFLPLFLDPENSIMIWRQSVNAAEYDGKGGKLWRPAIVQFIR